MASDPSGNLYSEVASILVPEIRDYVQINLQILRLLDAGHSRIRLLGAEGQRLLASGFAGSWRATIEVMGRTGPELGANTDAPGLRIIALGSTLDGAGRGLRAGLVVVVGDAGDGLGSFQTGGSLLVTGNAGHRAGLNQAGGTMAVFGSTGRLAGDRQSGGRIFLGPAGNGPHSGRAQRGGRRIGWLDPLEPGDRLAWDDLVEQVQGDVNPDLLIRP